MGTNFYTKKSNEHIGKRSAAGWYCWDCKVTFCARGEAYVHYTPSNEDVRIVVSRYGKDVDENCWFFNCPGCKKPKPKTSSLIFGSVARELGFDKSPFGPKTGIEPCSSFSWAMDPEGDEYKKLLKSRSKPIVDEYGNEYSASDWLKLLEECPIRFMHIGEEFS